MKKTQVRNLVFAALCVALGLALPQAFHFVPIPMAGVIFSPMHIPVLLCGLLCGWYWGLFCGVVTPVLSSLLFGMPPAAMLPGMILELAIYGLVAGLLYRKFKLNLPVSLVCAMLLGRIGYGLMQTVLFLAGGSEYSFQIFFTGLFVRGLPGIVLQLILVPLLLVALEKAGVVAKPRLAAKTAQ